MKLGDLPIGARLLFRSRKDWRSAVVARRIEDLVTLSVASPTGCNYRVRRDATAEIALDGRIVFLLDDCAESWRENLSVCDKRW